jgi:hypothetical protein
LLYVPLLILARFEHLTIVSKTGVLSLEVHGAFARTPAAAGQDLISDPPRRTAYSRDPALQIPLNLLGRRCPR